MWPADTLTALPWVDSVQQELLASLNHKYSGREVAEAKRAVSYQKALFDQLVNRPKKGLKEGGLPGSDGI